MSWNDTNWPFSEADMLQSTTDELVATILSQRDITVYQGGSLGGLAAAYSTLAAQTQLSDDTAGDTAEAMAR
eukprot:11086038-Heterocapsa_arctica.AAC.1